MKNLVMCAALALLGGSPAFSDVELYLVSGGSSVLVMAANCPGGNEACYANPNFNGWNIQLIAAGSNSPTLGPPSPFGLVLASDFLPVTCVTSQCSRDPLDVWASDIDFTQGTSEFASSFIASQQGGSGISTTQSVYEGLNNDYFSANGNDGTPSDGILAGSITFTGNGNGLFSRLGGGVPAGPSPYSLTIEDIFNANGTSASFLESEVSVSAVPEPASVSLLGGLLLGCAHSCAAGRSRGSNRFDRLLWR